VARAQGAAGTMQRHAELLRQRRPAARVAFEAYEHDRQHAGALLAGGLAYRLFLWLLPVALVAVAVVSLTGHLSSISPEEVAHQSGLPAALAATIGRAANDTSRGAAPLLLVGLWALILAGKSVVKAFRVVAFVVWQITPRPLAHGIRASLAFSGVAAGLLFSPNLLRPLYRGPFVLDLLVWVLTTLALIPVFAWLLGLLPHADGVDTRALLPGALLLAAGFQGLRIASSVYLAGRLERLNDLYGALGIALVVMVWLFLAGRLIVAAMTLNAARFRSGSRSNRPTDLRGGPGKPTSDSVTREQILRRARDITRVKADPGR
jgi:uncharacterized BrkB/YihY/UPF0761 family membrane protein